MTDPRGGDVRHAWTVAALVVVFVAGVHLDGWAHNHGRVDDSFFTPWHAVLYTSYLVVAVVLVRPVLVRRAEGLSWSEAARPVERLALVGIVVFAAGGVGDMAWHTAFGVEEDLEALLSPTHLLLAVGGTFMGTAAFLGSRPHREGGWRVSGPAVLAAIALWSVFTFMTQFMHPLVELWPTTDWRLTGRYVDLGEALGVAGILIQATVATAIVLFLLVADRLPAGAIALLVTVNAGFAVTQGDDYWLVLPMVLVGALGELSRRLLDPGPRPGWRIRMFGFVLAALFVAGPMAGLAIGPGVAWSIDLWSGSIVAAGLLGALASTVIVLPRD